MEHQYFEQFIAGQFERADRYVESVNPSTGKAWAMVPMASEADVDRAVRSAHDTLFSGSWASTTPTERGEMLTRLGNLLEQNAERLAEFETRDTGKIIRETAGQIRYMAQFYRYFGGLADKVQGCHVGIDKPDLDVTIQREPIGVVAAVVPWNSQFMLSAVKLGPALAAGCSVVLKASEDAPTPLLEFGRLVQEAGFPEGVVNILTGTGEECGKVLTSHPLVARIAFTGGPETARNVVRNSADNLAHTTLELGGKSPVVVVPDADLDSATNAVVAGIFAASGQSCVAGSRLLVHESVRDELVQRLLQKASAIRIGDPQDMATEMGPLATNRQLEHVESLIARAVEAGATLECGGNRVDRGGGFYFEPTILGCSDSANPALKEEFFGPVLSVLSFENEAEAVALANDTAYGLAAGVFTRDLARGHRVVRSIRSGIVWVNTYRAVSPLVPFGGFGLSGYGREGGVESILDYTRGKAVWIRTSDEPIPDPFVMR